MHTLKGCASFVPLLVAGCLLSCRGQPTDVNEPTTDPADVVAMAIYDANPSTSGDLQDDLVNYNVTDPAAIAKLFTGIEFSVERDCQGMEADNTAYLYARFKDGARKPYTLFLRDSHIALRNERETCFYVEPTAREVIRANAQAS